ncbi:hypothetical protein GGR54DRAFT_276577 [Hypoxylon sp. NC1633]|nr:hypothetical protein GGR54DRAFT_276577 [Hypoxylon sp. NC1633]
MFSEPNLEDSTEYPRDTRRSSSVTLPDEDSVQSDLSAEDAMNIEEQSSLPAEGTMHKEEHADETKVPKERSCTTSSVNSRYRSPVIPVHVGGSLDPHTFYVHKSVLLEVDYFKKALSDESQEPGAEFINLLEESPRTFQHVVAYLYERRRIGRTAAESLSPLTLGDEKFMGSLHLHADVYILAGKLQYAGLQLCLLSICKTVVDRLGPRHADPDFLSLCLQLHKELPETDHLVKLVFRRLGGLQPHLWKNHAKETAQFFHDHPEVAVLMSKEMLVSATPADQRASAKDAARPSSMIMNFRPTDNLCALSAPGRKGEVMQAQQHHQQLVARIQQQHQQIMQHQLRNQQQQTQLQRYMDLASKVLPGQAHPVFGSTPASQTG